MFPFLQSLGYSHVTVMTFQISWESGLATTSVNSLRTLGCMFPGHTDLGMFRFLKWLLFSYRGRNFAPFSPCLEIHRFERLRRETYNEDWGKNIAEYLRLFFSSAETSLPVMLITSNMLLFSFLAEISTEVLIFLCIPLLISAPALP